MIKFANRYRGRGQPSGRTSPAVPFTGGGWRVKALITDCRTAARAWIDYHRITPISSRKLTPWTADEVREMRYLHRQGHSIKVIAWRLNRTFYSVDTKLRRLLHG